MSEALLTFSPIAVTRLELTEPLMDLEAERRADGAAYSSASVLVTLHRRPLGMATVDFTDGGVSAACLAEAIQAQLATEISTHLQACGFTPRPLAASGLTECALAVEDAPCWNGLPSRADMPMISVVIPTKDRTEELERCLHRLLALDYPDFELIAVDNGSADAATRSMIEQRFADDDRVRYVHLDVASASLARNAGLEAARGSIVAFTDDDVVVDDLWLSALARQFARYPEADCVTGLVLPAAFDHQAQQWFEEYGGFGKGFEPLVFTRQRPESGSILYPFTAGTFGSGNNCAFRRDALLSRGGFDPTLGPGTPTHAGEDLDAFLAIIMSGRTIAYEPAAIISHYHRSDTAGLRRQLQNYGVGLTAMMTKWMLKSPGTALSIAARIPLGLWFLLSPKSAKNEAKSESFPSNLGRAELRGMIYGPLAYVKGRSTGRN